MLTADQLARYLARLGLPAARVRDGADLAGLQFAHRLAFGFENLDVMLGRPIAIDSQSVFDKFVGRGRGGYCFEHNRLYADALAALGCTVRPVLARVRLGVQPGAPLPPRTHVALVVEIGGETWLADAGFGGSLLPAMPLEHGAAAKTGDGARHRLLRVGEPGEAEGQWRLERAGPREATDGRAAAHADWQAQYTFDLAHVAPADLEQANHWTSTRAGTRFTTLHVASRPNATAFASMVDCRLTLHEGGETRERTIGGAEDYVRALREVFAIALPLADARALPLFA